MLNIHEESPYPDACPLNGLIGPLHHIGSIKVLPSKESSIPGHQYMALPADLSRTDPTIVSWTNGGRLGSGFSFTSKYTAMRRAIGEALEGYAGSYAARNALMKTASANTLTQSGTPHIPPAAFARFILIDQTSQHVYTPFSREIEVDWVEGMSCVSNRPVWVPAQYGLCPYTPMRQMPPLVQCTSNGVAAHTNKAGALLNAIAELLERDSILLHWWNRIPARRIINETVPKSIQNHIAHYTAIGIDIRLYHMPARLGWNTCLACIYQQHKKFSPWICGHACHADSHIAIVSALEEMTKTFKTLSHREFLRKAATYKDFTTIKTATDHYYFYCYPAHWRKLSWFLPDTPSVDYATLNTHLHMQQAEEILDQYVPLISATFPHAAYVYCTPPDLQELGHHVIRAVLPGIAPLCFGHPIGYWTHEHMDTYVSQCAGYPTNIREPNIWPHPLA